MSTEHTQSAAPALSANEAYTLLALNLAGQTAQQIEWTLAERGRNMNGKTLKRQLCKLTERGLITFTGGSGQRGAVYRLGAGADTEAALDSAFEALHTGATLRGDR